MFFTLLGVPSLLIVRSSDPALWFLLQCWGAPQGGTQEHFNHTWKVSEMRTPFNPHLYYIFFPLCPVNNTYHVYLNYFSIGFFRSILNNINFQNKFLFLNATYCAISYAKSKLRLKKCICMQRAKLAVVPSCPISGRNNYGTKTTSQIISR